MSQSVAIVVHIYKSSLDAYEKISLTQLHLVLGHYPVHLIAPDGLDVSEYGMILREQLVSTIRFHPNYFKNLKGYNALLLNKEYYKPFLGYRYILLHHTDSFVFRDDLATWVDKGYDQIGAPVYEYDGTAHPVNYFFSGNGGLSLRKVETFYLLSQSFHSVFNWDEVRDDFRNYSWKGKLWRMPYYLMMISKLGSRLHPAFNLIHINEDAIWGMLVPKYIPEFKNAPFEDGLQFSMEFNCDKLIELNENRLPFGCHGWYKPMFIDFWRPRIEALGYSF